MLEEIGLSSDMEALVFDLLEELRDEAPVLGGSAVAPAHEATASLLLRACASLRFVDRHAKQAVGIVLSRSGGASLLARPTLLSDTLDWLCVHVPLDELPLAFRPKLRPIAVRAAAGMSGARSGAVVLGAVGAEDEEEEVPLSAAVEAGQINRLAGLGFLRSRCAAALSQTGGVEEAALALLLREMALRLEPVAAVGAEGGAAGGMAALCAPAEEAEAEALRAACEEEETAMQAILGSEYGLLPGGCRLVTLLWDSATGEAPWAFTAAHSGQAEAGVGGGPPPHCPRCVLRGCRLPTSRHVPSAYCTRAHAEARRMPDGPRRARGGAARRSTSRAPRA